MVRKLQTLLIMAFILSATMAMGQRKLQKANKQYGLKHYDLAIETYKDFLVESPGNLEARINLADSYRMSNKLVEAGKLYEDLASMEHIPADVLKNYGLTLMKMGKYDQAKYYFQIYKVYDATEGEHYTMACDHAKHLFIEPAKFEIELVNVNTPNSDFGVTFFDDQMIFSSFRNDMTGGKSKKGQPLNGNILYTADLSDDMRADNVRFLRSGISEKVNIGPVSYNKDGGIAAFSRNKIKDGGAHVTGDDSKHSLYIGKLSANGDWEDEQSFRYNEFGTSTAFPSLAFDGSALYFASNRVGGYGGYDIYVCYYKNGEWTYPRNLGATVNTKGNEITPFFADENLYFASDYMHGMGGYDIFKSVVDGGQWSFPINMGNGVNSPGDDYYPSVKRGSEMIFFSSNRLGGRGMDDIYLAAPVKERELAQVSESPPPAVKLSDLAVKISPQNINPTVQTVSSVESTEVKLISTDAELSMPASVDVSNYVPKVLAKTETLETKELVKTTAAVAIAAETKTTQADIKSDNKVIERSSYTITEEPEITAFEETYLTKGREISIKQIESTIEVDENGDITEVITVTEIENEKPKVKLKQENIVVNEVREEVKFQPTVDTEAVPETYKLPDFAAVSPSAAPLNLDLSSAKRVALNEILPASEVYFIQLAALYRTTGNVNKYNGLKKYGNLYKVYKANSTKIKLGYFYEKREADAVLRQVKSQGYNDAFITKDVLNSGELELMVASEAQSDFNSYTSEPSTTSSYNSTTLNAPANKSYKIRLASYEDPIWFDIAKAKDLGQIEQWTKGGWTIFILGGFNNYEDAESARIRAANKGFLDAEVVIDNNGILERLRKN